MLSIKHFAGETKQLQHSTITASWSKTILYSNWKGYEFKFNENYKLHRYTASQQKDLEAGIRTQGVKAGHIMSNFRQLFDNTFLFDLVTQAWHSVEKIWIRWI